MRLRLPDLVKAQQLRDEGLSYPAIAVVMRRYHAVEAAPDTWRRALKSVGLWRRPSYMNGGWPATRKAMR